MTKNIGFTLIELAFILLVLSLLLVNLLEPLSANIAKRQRERTDEVLEEIQLALLGYAQLNGHLPCAAQSNGNGEERRAASGICSYTEGDIPWVDLGAEGRDAWGQPIRYRPQRKYTYNPIEFHSDYGLTILSALNTELSTKSESRIAAIMFSRGLNRKPDLCNDRSNLPVTCDDSTDAIYYTQDGPIQTIDGTNDFDDMLVWLPRNVLFTHLTKAEKWDP